MFVAFFLVLHIICVFHSSLSRILCCIVFFFFKQKTAYEMRISDWSSDVCSSDLLVTAIPFGIYDLVEAMDNVESAEAGGDHFPTTRVITADGVVSLIGCLLGNPFINAVYIGHPGWKRSEEHTSELQSLMRLSYAVFCLKKKKQITKKNTHKDMKK